MHLLAPYISFFLVLENSPSPGSSNLFYGGVWIFSGTAQSERKMMGCQILIFNAEFCLSKSCALGIQSNMFMALFKPFLRKLEDTENFSF